MRHGWVQLVLSTLVDETFESIVRMGFDVPEGIEFRPPPRLDEATGRT